MFCFFIYNFINTITVFIAAFTHERIATIPFAHWIDRYVWLKNSNTRRRHAVIMQSLRVKRNGNPFTIHHTQRTDRKKVYSSQLVPVNNADLHIQSHRRSVAVVWSTTVRAAPDVARAIFDFEVHTTRVALVALDCFICGLRAGPANYYYKIMAIASKARKQK